MSVLLGYVLFVSGILVPHVVVVSPAGPGQCSIAVGPAKIIVKALDCKAIRASKPSLGPLLAVDWRFDDRTERLLVVAEPTTLRVVLRRVVRSESMPAEESGDTLQTKASIAVMPGAAFGGLPMLIETRRSWATQFNRVDRKPDDVEIERTVFVFDGTVYRAAPPPD